jgi:hypothetical protein
MNPHQIEIFINKKKYEVAHAEQTGASLKHLAGIPLTDVLFLQPRWTPKTGHLWTPENRPTERNQDNSSYTLEGAVRATAFWRR